MYSYQPYQQTEANKILQASPEQLILMLLEGVMTQVKRVRERYKAGQTVQWKESVNRAMRILNFLQESLNMEKGGEIATNLERIYFFAIDKLFQASRSEDPIPNVEQVERVIGIIYKSWAQIAAGK